MTNQLISICIPTCRRPDLLREAIEGCFRQAYRPLELVIGDDSGDSLSKEMTDAIPIPDGISIRHVVHPTPLRQARNVNWLFTNATGSRLLLLHDDDGLCENALSKLADAWDSEAGVVCVYGKFHIASLEGVFLASETEKHNALYGRVSAAAGIQDSAITAGLSQQLPHNCYLVNAELAKSVLYRTEQEIGNSGDVDFGIRLAMAAGSGRFLFVDEYISFYRMTKNSILRSRRGIYGWHLLYENVESLTVPEQDQPARDSLLERIAALSVVDAAMAGKRRKALSILFSAHYPLRFTDVRTAYRLLYVVSPSLGNLLTDIVLPSSR